LLLCGKLPRIDLSLFDLKLEEPERVCEETGISIVGGLPLFRSAEDPFQLKLDREVASGEDNLAHITIFV
jgi:hypothetical protein